MIVAKKYVENKIQENNPPKKQKTQKLHKKIEQSSIQKIYLIVCLSFAVLGTICAVFSVILNNFSFIKPNIMPSNYIFYILIAFNAISLGCFIFQNYKAFNFNTTFSLCSSSFLNLLTYVFIFVFPNKIFVLVAGILLFICSSATNSSFNMSTNKSCSPFLIAHLINLYLTFASVFIYLVN